MADWLRPVFRRSRSSSPSSRSSFERLISPRSSGSYDGEGSVRSRSRPRSRPPLSRVSSYLGLRSSSPPPSFPPLDVFQGTQNPETLYHMPSADQMVETLKAVMMRRGTLDALPIEYNACVLHVLEAYQDMREQLKTKANALEELKRSHTKDIKEFEDLATKWEAKEQDYKMELKKLEVLLSKTKGGMETVVMARSNSRVHGSGRASEVIGRGLNSIKVGHAAPYAQDDIERDKPTTTFDKRRRNAHNPKFSRSQLEAMDRKERERVLGLGSDSSSSSSSFYGSSISSWNEQSPSADKLPGFGTLTNKSPLTNGLLTAACFEEHSGSGTMDFDETKFPGLGPGHMSFSFRPGDDAGFLSKTLASETGFLEIPKDETQQKGPKDPSQRTPTLRPKARNVGDVRTRSDPVKPESRQPNRKTSRPDRQKHSIHVKSAINDQTKRTKQQSLTRKNSNSSIVTAIRCPDRQKPYIRVKSAINDQTKWTKQQPLTRKNSNSSIITAIRHNSGRSSPTGGRPEKQATRPHPDRPGSFNEAVTAAARAFMVNRAVLGRRKKSPGAEAGAGENIKKTGKSLKKKPGSTSSANK